MHESCGIERLLLCDRLITQNYRHLVGESQFLHLANFRDGDRRSRSVPKERRGGASSHRHTIVQNFCYLPASLTIPIDGKLFY
ncbi:MAG TPA: hypothetical protein V6D25_16195 [Leptolyngbyaceae cyanobacterium]